MLHLAIFSPGYINKIFTGRKSIDGRFSVIRCAPFGMVEKGDLILMKKSGGSVVGYFVAGKVTHLDNPSPNKLKQIIQKYWNELCISNGFWKAKKNSKFVTLIEIKQPTKFRIPVTVKKHGLAGWVTLGGESQKQIELF